MASFPFNQTLPNAPEKQNQCFCKSSWRLKYILKCPATFGVPKGSTLTLYYAMQ